MDSPLFAALALKPGTVLADKYCLERVLGQGGMGVVVAARHLELHDMVALKMLLPSVALNPTAVARFSREARASVKIKSPHVARTMDVGKLDSGIPYIVMEYLEGESLAQRLSRSGPLSVDTAVEFTIQATHAVAEAHNLGIVHRDLKPANLFVVRHRDTTESIKVLDFGVSKLVEATNRSMLETLTQTAAPPGSPPYMAPEQLEDSTQADSRCDVWSLGVTLYELLAGVRPFRGKSLTEICLRILRDPHPSLRETRPEVPAGLEAIVNRCLAKTPERRFGDVGALSLALAPFGPDATRHTAILAARMSENTGEQAMRRRHSESVRPMPTERSDTESIPAPPSVAAASSHAPAMAAGIASQETRTAISEVSTRTSVAPSSDRLPHPNRRRVLWLIAATLAATLGTLGALHYALNAPDAPTRNSSSADEKLTHRTEARGQMHEDATPNHGSPAGPEPGSADANLSDTSGRAAGARPSPDSADADLSDTSGRAAGARASAESSDPSETKESQAEALPDRRAEKRDPSSPASPSGDSTESPTSPRKASDGETAPSDGEFGPRT